MAGVSARVALQASGLSKRFGANTAVDNVSLTIGEGECLALLGPNGAGKTTICEMLVGLQQPDAGSIEILGQSLVRDRATILQRLGVQLQGARLYKKYTVRETLALFSSFYAKTIDRETLMARLQLTDKADARLESLSGGQEQRVYLACALINDPALIFLDEPTTGLDPQIRHALWTIIEELKREGRSILLTTHYMDEAQRLADRVAIIDRGRIVAQGSTRDLIIQHGGQESLRFAVHHGGIALRQWPAEILRAWPWLSEGIWQENEFELLTTDAGQRLQDLGRICSDGSFQLHSVTLRPVGLEDVFLKLTGRAMRDDQ